MFYWLYTLNKDSSLFNVFRYVPFRSLAALLTALFLYLFLGKKLIRFLTQKQIGQIIREEGPESHQTKKGTPTMGGALILFAGVISVLLWGNLEEKLVWLCLGVFLFFGGIGLWDDWKKFTKRHNSGLSGRQKIVLQIFGAILFGVLLMVWADYDRTLYLPFLKSFTPDLGWAYLLLIVFVLVGASNALNLTDGLDGLAAGPTVVSFSTYAVFAYTAGNLTISRYLYVAYVPGAAETAIFCAAIVGAVIGFLWYNSYPAEIFMGDVGSLSLGASFGFIGIVTKQEALLALVGGVFVLETLSVMSQVVSFKLTGKRLFKMSPIHHHFELKGWPEPKVIVRFWIMSLVCAILALSTLKLR